MVQDDEDKTSLYSKREGILLSGQHLYCGGIPLHLLFYTQYLAIELLSPEKITTKRCSEFTIILES